MLQFGTRIVSVGPIVSENKSFKVYHGSVGKDFVYISMTCTYGGFPDLALLVLEERPFGKLL